jgi:hypothetical protein
MQRLDVLKRVKTDKRYSGSNASIGIEYTAKFKGWALENPYVVGGPVMVASWRRLRIT